MPRKAKEIIEKDEEIKTKKTSMKSSNKKAGAKTASKVENSKASTSTSKKATKKATSKKEDISSKKATSTRAKKVTTTNAKGTNTSVKKSTTTSAKKTTTSRTTKTATTRAKNTTTSRTGKATTRTKNSTNTRTKKATSTRSKNGVATPTPEYYDLPYHYDQTVVKVLAQTPKTLFVYWDVSNQDRENYEKQFGPNFFNNTVPFLRVKNETKNYFFDVDVDDFANGWYINVEDSRCNYSVELLRKQRPYTENVVDQPTYITSSNRMETPNDHILFDTNYSAVYFRNVKTNEVSSKNMASISLLKKVGKIYNIYDFYKKIYKNEDVGDIFNLNNPSSGNPTSTFK